MSKKTSTKLPELTAWHAESLRLTAFLSANAKIPEPTWWKDLTGKTPDTKNLRLNKGEQEEIGTFNNGQLILRIQPIRIDWLFAGVEDQKEGIECPTIGSFPEALDQFGKLMSTWLNSSSCPSIQRLAFGAVLLQPVTDQRAGYAALADYLHSVEVDLNSTDFMYQINRARDYSAQVKGLRINRLSKWSVASMQRIGIEIKPTSTQGHQIGSVQFFFRLELDINSNADFPSELPSQQLARIFQTFTEFAKEIAAEGDIP